MIQKYPIGIQDFRKLREEGYVYIDKTQHIHRLITQGSYYFLSRPRRFGKSLLLSTMKEIFLGNQELFKGLWIEDQIDWQRTSPVIHLSFAQLDTRDRSLTDSLSDQLVKIADSFGISLKAPTLKEKHTEIIEKIYKLHSRVVILIDEYDKPIIDFLGQDELPIALTNRDILKSGSVNFLTDKIKVVMKRPEFDMQI